MSRGGNVDEDGSLWESNEGAQESALRNSSLVINVKHTVAVADRGELHLSDGVDDGPDRDGFFSAT